MTEEEKKKSRVLYDEYTKNASEEDIEKIRSNLDGMNRGEIAKIWDKVLKLWALVKDPHAGWGAKTLAIGALVYLISPVDAIPDIIPFLGLTDDAGVITAAMAALADALSKYEK